MAKKTLLAMAVLGMVVGTFPALSPADQPGGPIPQDQNQYNHDQAVLKQTQDRINQLNQQIQNVEKPVQMKYQGLDQALEKIDKPYRDQINKLNQEMQQVDQPYRKQIIERNEEMKRVQRETEPYREEIRHLNESSRDERRVLDADAQRLQADRVAQHQWQMQQKAIKQPPVAPKAAKTPPKVVPKNVVNVIKNPGQQPAQ
jgi:chromosome segregation ATPase